MVRLEVVLLKALPLMKTIRERLDAIGQQQFVTVREFALLLNVSERTIWRRLAELPHVIRDGRVTRIHRVSALRHMVKRAS